MSESDTDVIDTRGRRSEKRSERRCIVSRDVLEPDQLIRFVVAPDGWLHPDIKAKLPGRGAWVGNSANRVREAMRKGLFGRALKCAVQIPEDLDRKVDVLLETRALDTLGLAANQGAVETGFSKVDGGVRSQRYGLVAFALDGAADSRRKLYAAVAAGGKTELPVYCGFTSDQMSLAMGRANVIHAGIVAGRMAAAATNAMRRLDTYRGAGALICPGA